MIVRMGIASILLLSLLSTASLGGVPEPDVRLHGLVSIGGELVVAGDDVTLRAELADTGQEVGRFAFGDVNLGDCNRNGIDDANEISDGAPDVDGDGILDECNHYVLCLRMEAFVAGETDRADYARVGDTVKIYAIDGRNKTCVGGDHNGDVCQSDEGCLGDPGGSNGVCTPAKVLMAVMEITDAGVLLPLDLGFCDANNDGVGDVVTSRLYVREDAPAGGDGSSWASALSSMAGALSVRECVGPFVTELWVAEGTYLPIIPAAPENPRLATFIVPAGLSLHGGFAGDESSLSERSISDHPTILSGDINGDDGAGEIDDNSYHVVTLDGVQGGEKLDGFVIRGGNANGSSDKAYGGGLLVSDSRVFVSNCRIVENTALLAGGGVHLFSGLVEWTDCEFIDNTSAGDGAGVSNRSSTVTFNRCVFDGNRIPGAGSNRRGGAVINNATGMKRCRSNGETGDPCWSDSDCKGCACRGVVFDSCVFNGNQADLGGAMANIQSSPSMINCTLSGNSSDRGGAVFNLGTSATGSAPIMINCEFVGNTANDWGGAVCNQAHTATALTNCTIAGNRSLSGTGGGIGSLDQPDNDNTVTATNCILWGNTSSTGSIREQQLNTVGISANVTYSCIEDDLADDGVVLAGVGNIDRNPMFALSPQPGDYGDLRLLVASPCCDAGNNTADVDPTFLDGIQPLIETDLAGDDRIADNLCVTDTGVPSVDQVFVDMGAYEFATPAVSGAILYVDDDATGLGDGSSWENALTDLQLAMCMSEGSGGDVQQVWVASGTYVPTLPTILGDPRSASFTPANGVEVYGGFAGGETSIDQRNLFANHSILSGDLNRDDSSGGDDSENAYHVLVVSQSNDESAVIDGFVITGGNASTNQGNKMLGGGVLVSDGEATFANCTFSGNKAIRGGGICVLGNSSPIFEYCDLIQNYATAHGGGMYTKNGATPMVINCRFIGNTADSTAGGMRNQDGASPTLVGCVFSGNAKDALYNNFSNPSIVNCTIVGSGEYGIRSTSMSNPSVVNSIIYGNSAGQVSGNVLATYSCVQGGLPGEGNIDDNPMFVDYAGGDYRLTRSSTCINSGDNSALPAGIDTDAGGQPRVVNGVVDMGSYEYQQAGDCDSDGDGFVNLDDYVAFWSCMAGPDAAPAPGAPLTAVECLNTFDGDMDGDVDLADFGRFTSLFEVH